MRTDAEADAAWNSAEYNAERARKAEAQLADLRRENESLHGKNLHLREALRRCMLQAKQALREYEYHDARPKLVSHDEIERGVDEAIGEASR